MRPPLGEYRTVLVYSMPLGGGIHRISSISSWFDRFSNIGFHEVSYFPVSVAKFGEVITVGKVEDLYRVRQQGGNCLASLPAFIAAPYIV